MKYKINNKTISFKQGGILKAQSGSNFPSFEQFYKSIPFKTDTTNYNLRRAFELAPKWQLEAWKIDPEHNHLNTIYWNENGEGEFMKNPNHPTIDLELKDYNSKPEFNSRYQLDTTKTPWKYILKAQPGMVLPTIPSALTKTYNKVENALTPISKWENKYNVKANASLGILQFVNPEAWVGIDPATLTTANFGNGGIKALKEVEQIPKITKSTNRHDSYLKALDTWTQRKYGIKYSNMKKDVQPRIEQEFKSKWRK